MTTVTAHTAESLKKECAAIVREMNQHDGIKLKKVGQSLNESGTRAAAIYQDKEFDEYRVLFFKDGVFQRDATYHGECLDDCANTAAFWISAADIKREFGPVENMPAKETQEPGLSPVSNPCKFDRLPTLTQSLFARIGLVPAFTM